MDEIEVYLDDEQLPEPYSEIQHIVEKEKLLEIAKIFGGSKIYFPKLKTITKPQRDRKIIEEFNGYNTRELAIKYDLTENWIRQICKEKISQERSKPCEGQITIDDLFNN